ncbi:hypothetical protein CEXT_34011 [Caerostris extrusa]|uniref:Uncharacterized protein n=1 Tax=Caerostris extrusa TaxID=172846 RepID=A0AAV4Q8J9_CAEEX|nr:hypothetical protein CEXT_34011 [Caerostris extrusa]
MDNEAQWQSTSQSISSKQKSVLSLKYNKRIDCEEKKTAAEMSSQYGVSNPNQNNPEISNFHISCWPPVEENEFISVNLQKKSEANKVYRNQNFDYSDASNPESIVNYSESSDSANNPMSLADQSLLPGFQQPFRTEKCDDESNYSKSGIINHCTEHRKLEYSSKVTCSLESQKPCDSSTTTAKESIPNYDNHSEDKILSKNVNSSKDFNTPTGKTVKQLNKCDEDQMTFLPTDHLAFPERSRNVAGSYKCKF